MLFRVMALDLFASDQSVIRKAERVMTKRMGDWGLIVGLENEKVNMASTVIDKDVVTRSLRTSPVHSSKDRTSIDDFEIIKLISQAGALWHRFYKEI